MPPPSLSLYVWALGLALRTCLSVKAMTVSRRSLPKEESPQCTVIDTDNFSGFKREPARTHECPRWIYAAASMVCWPSANDREQLRTLMWLGREDSNLRMAESKSYVLAFRLYLNVLFSWKRPYL